MEVDVKSSSEMKIFQIDKNYEYLNHVSCIRIAKMNFFEAINRIIYGKFYLTHTNVQIHIRVILNLKLKDFPLQI